MMDFSTYRPRSATPSLSSASTSSSSAVSRLGSAFFTPSTFDERNQDAPWENGAGPNRSEMDDDHDHVKWQGSQTACQALNQLINSSTNDVATLRARSSWQRESSFDQIPGFSLLSTKDVPSSSVFESPLLASKAKHKPSTSELTSAGPASRPPSRSRLPESKTRPRSSSAAPDRDVTNLPLPVPAPLPFFDKGNPEKFLEIVKGVAKRVDENAGLRPRATKSISSSSIMAEASTSTAAVVTAQKRSRVQSLGSAASESSKAVKRKKGHTDVNGSEKESIKSKGKMKEAAPINEPVNDPEGQVHEQPKTSSQVRMPPPALPMVYPGPRNAAQQPSAQSSSVSASLSTSPHLNAPRPVEANSTRNESSRTPKLHPLLVQQSQGKPSSSASPSIPPGRATAYKPHTNTNSVPYSKPQPASSTTYQVQVKHATHPLELSSHTHHQSNSRPSVLNAVPQYSPAPASQHSKVSSALPSSTPSSSYNSRPPALGMRRTNTYPSSLQQKAGDLPKKQKGFKPPLLTNSQPQSQVQSQSMQIQTRVKVEKEVAAGMVGVTGPEAYSKPKSKTSGSCSGTAAPRTASYANPTAGHSSKPMLAPSTKNQPHQIAENPLPARHQHRPAPTGLADCVAIAATVPSASRHPGPRAAGQAVRAPPVPSPEPLPEPADGDPDSSFGDIDMPFDMDALEETMKQYD